MNWIVLQFRVVPVVAAIAVLCPFCASALDDDGDGMSDVWQRAYNIPTASGTNDLDGDGFSNLLENYFGTNPRLNGFPTPLLDTYGLPVIGVTSGGFVGARWRTVVGIRYQVQRSTNLVNWVNVGTPSTGSGAIFTVASTSFPVTNTVRVFYRLGPIPSLDSDGDGLNAFEEGLLGTSDTDTDSDGDYVSDVIEFRLGLHPATAASNDGDAIPDDWEIFHFGSAAALAGSDPDNDGFSNRDEFEFNLNPNLNDFADGMVTHIYTYDDAGRLKTVNNALTEGFAYDPEGNLTNSH